MPISFNTDASSLEISSQNFASTLISSPSFSNPCVGEARGRNKGRCHGLEKLEEEIRVYAKFWEEISRDEATVLKEMGFMVASSFVHWEGVDENGKTENGKSGVCVRLGADAVYCYEGETGEYLQSRA